MNAMKDNERHHTGERNLLEAEDDIHRTISPKDVAIHDSNSVGQGNHIRKESQKGTP